jgi:hypothetical protein
MGSDGPPRRTKRRCGSKRRRKRVLTPTGVSYQPASHTNRRLIPTGVSHQPASHTVRAVLRTASLAQPNVGLTTRRARARARGGHGTFAGPWGRRAESQFAGQ